MRPWTSREVANRRQSLSIQAVDRCRLALAGPARSPVELRRRPDRLTDVIAAFLDDVWSGDEQSDTSALANGRAG